jgi:acyl carrier protein
MQSYDQILTRLAKILQGHAGGVESIDENMLLVSDLHLDSPQVMALLLEIEDEFDVSVPLNVLPDVETVEDLATQLHRLLEQQS